MGCCPFSSSSRDTTRLYRDTTGHRPVLGRDTTWPACWGAQQSSTTRRATWPGLHAGMSGSARASWPQWCVAIRFLYHKR